MSLQIDIWLYIVDDFRTLDCYAKSVQLSVRIRLQQETIC